VVPTTAGEPVLCSELPVSGYYRIGYSTRSCWVIRENTVGNSDFFWMAGADMDHPVEGALVHGDVTGSDDVIEVAILPGNHGRLTIRRAKRDVACVRAADGAWFLFRLGTRRFVAVRRDCIRAI
jgi:hypothetical protein